MTATPPIPVPDADPAASGLYPLQDGQGMTASTERAVHRDVSDRWSKAIQYLRHHDRPMCTRRRLARCQHLFHILLVPLGI